MRVGFHCGFASALFVTAFQPFVSIGIAGTINARWSGAMFLFVWLMYLADRIKVNPEDAHESDGNAAAFVRQNRTVMRLLMVGLLAGQAVLVWMDHLLVVPLTLGTLISLLYLIRVPLLQRRIKEVPYAKCFYLAVAALSLVVLFTPGLLGGITASGIRVLGACFVAYFLNFSLYDIKDVESDRRAGIRTLAGAFLPSTFLNAQIASSLVTMVAVLLFLPGTLAAVLSLLCLFHAGASAWLRRHPFDGAMCGIVDTGYGIIVGLGTVLVVRSPW